MLEQVLDFIHNYFEKEIVRGTFTISSHNVDVSFLQEGQYVRVVGSVFNDGIHTYPASDLTDEVFEGEIWAMAVPPAVIALSQDISNWVSANGDNSPFTSESFGGYSYTKGSSTKNGTTTPLSWRDVFASRLNHWRKIS